MNLKTIFTIVATILFVNANAQNSLNYIQKENLNNDFDFLVNAIKQTHPNPYSVISKSEFDNKVSNIRKSFQDSLTLKEYYRLIAPFVASLQDGHTFLTFPGIKLLNANDNLLPYIIKADIEKPHLKVTENISDDYLQIPVGAEILKINNYTAEEIIQKIIDNTSGESKAYRLKMGANLIMFAIIFGTFYELEETAKVEYKFENQTFKKTIPTVTYTNLMEIAKNRKPNNKNNNIEVPNFSLTLKSELKTAILEIRYFGDKTKFQDFLKESFKTINDKKIKKIVIDIRENGGGNSKLGDELLKYLSPKPFKQFDQTLIKYSQLQKDVYKRYCESDTQYCSTYNYVKTKNNGEVETFSVEDLIEAYQKSERFNGKIYLLTSTRTFSSAMTFTQAFKHYKIGKIIGEETGGWIVSYGDRITTSLPVSNIPLSISTKKFYSIGATDKDLHGVKPDIEIKAEKALDYTLNK